MWNHLSCSNYGVNDKVEANVSDFITHSLRLAHIDNLIISVILSYPGTEYERVKVRAKFQHCSIQYNLSVTDPIYENHYLKMDVGDYDIGECFLTISIGEPMDDGNRYLLVAAIMARDAGNRKI